TDETVKGNADALAAHKADILQRGINVMHPPVPMIAAVGDGVTDDTAAVQAILDSGYAYIFFPEPPIKYLITAPLTVPDTVRFIDGLQSHIYYDYEQSGTPSYFESLFVVDQVDDLTVSNLKLEYGGTFD